MMTDNKVKEIAKLRSYAPWPIPKTAKAEIEEKAEGYLQVKFSWTKDSWRYEARYHEKTPQAKLITYPSWRLDRIRPGKGYGPDHAPRISQTRVSQKWLSTSYVRYCARQLNHGLASQSQIKIIKLAHVKANF